MATFTKRGTRWRVQIRRNGQPPISKTLRSKQDADVWQRDMESKLDRGQRIEPGLRLTFAEMISAYRKHVTTAKPLGRSKDQALGKVEKALGMHRLSELKTAVFLAYCQRREHEGAGPATILLDFSFIGTVLRHGGALVNGEEAAATALSQLDSARRTLLHSGRIAKPEERERRPSDEELGRLINFWTSRPRQQIPMVELMLFAAATAMRLGEILKLQWEDFDEDAKAIIIRARKHPTKKKTNHQQVPLMRGPCTIQGRVIDPVDIIRRQPTGNQRVGRIFPYSAASTSTAFQRATNTLGIDDLHFHDLRHDGISRLFAHGLPIEKVARISGHKDWNQLRRYTQLNVADFHPKVGLEKTLAQIPIAAANTTTEKAA